MKKYNGYFFRLDKLFKIKLKSYNGTTIGSQHKNIEFRYVENNPKVSGKFAFDIISLMGKTIGPFQMLDFINEDMAIAYNLKDDSCCIVDFQKGIFSDKFRSLSYIPYKNLQADFYLPGHPTYGKSQFSENFSFADNSNRIFRITQNGDKVLSDFTLVNKDDRLDSLEPVAVTDTNGETKFIDHNLKECPPPNYEEIERRGKEWEEARERATKRLKAEEAEQAQKGLLKTESNKESILNLALGMSIGAASNNMSLGLLTYFANESIRKATEELEVENNIH